MSSKKNKYKVLRIKPNSSDYKDIVNEINLGMLIRDDEVTSFHDAVRNNNIHEVKKTLESKASILNMLHPKVGLTALHIAVIYNNEEMLKLLLSCRNINPNTSDQDGYLPIHYAIEYNSNNLLKILMPYVEYDYKDKHGNTLLYHAVLKSNYEAMKTLVGKVESISSKNKEGKSAYDYLLMQKNIIEELKDSTTSIFTSHINEYNFTQAIEFKHTISSLEQELEIIGKILG